MVWKLQVSRHEIFVSYTEATIDPVYSLNVIELKLLRILGEQVFLVFKWSAGACHLLGLFTLSAFMPSRKSIKGT
jgi:hypothetical protein